MAFVSRGILEPNGPLRLLETLNDLNVLFKASLKMDVEGTRDGCLLWLAAPLHHALVVDVMRTINLAYMCAICVAFLGVF